MPPEVSRVELYYDSDASQPKEDPERIEERLAEIAESQGIEYETIDTAGYSEEKRKEFYHDATVRIREDREYHVGNRVFTRGMFGSTRPVLLIHFEDRDGIDLYPHRSEGRQGVVGVLDFFDDVTGETDEESEAGAAATEGPAASGDENASEDSGRTGASDAGLLSRLSALLPG